MSKIEEIKQRKELFLVCLYQYVGGVSSKEVDPYLIGEKLGYSREETNHIVDHYCDEYLIHRNSKRNTIHLDSMGVSHVEIYQNELENLLKKHTTQIKSGNIESHDEQISPQQNIEITKLDRENPYRTHILLLWGLTILNTLLIIIGIWD
ncbi:hypothetical protein [Risungbinella massiliensis]|uniref:hypothetical protein n=1 Tax=Risungbinella massiliensis TaxID=1329796 RepID=UPI0005CBA8E3|nr:hypothetical protein [Risungbinella massiliensis]